MLPLPSCSHCVSWDVVAASANPLISALPPFSLPDMALTGKMPDFLVQVHKFACL